MLETAVATPDTIIDFAEGTLGEMIDLSFIDANTTSAGDQAFLFAGNTATVSANSLNWYQSGGNTFVEGDVNGDAVADFRIMLTGLHTLSDVGPTPDFLL